MNYYYMINDNYIKLQTVKITRLSWKESKIHQCPRRKHYSKYYQEESLVYSTSKRLGEVMEMK